MLDLQNLWRPDRFLLFLFDINPVCEPIYLKIVYWRFESCNVRFKVRIFVSFNFVCSTNPLDTFSFTKIKYKFHCTLWKVVYKSLPCGIIFSKWVSSNNFPCLINVFTCSLIFSFSFSKRQKVYASFFTSITNFAEGDICTNESQKLSITSAWYRVSLLRDSIISVW